MYKEFRVFEEKSNKISVSSPEAWARNLSVRRKINFLTKIKIVFDVRYHLIKKYFDVGEKVLDAGCGFGEWVGYLNMLGFSAVGLDYSKDLINQLGHVYKEYDWIVGQIEELPIKNGACDGIISWGVIEHNENGPGQALNEFYRVLKPGGRMIVTVPHEDRLAIESSRKMFSANIAHLPKVFFQFYMTEKDIRSIATAHGFEVIKIGLQPPAALGKVLPVAYMHLSDYPAILRLAIYVFGALFFWKKDWGFMMYCVCRKPLDIILR